jgi:hypothetical protein
VTAEVATDRRRLPRWALAAPAVALLVAAAVLAGPPAGDAPLDPTSVAPDGLRGVRDLLAEMGVESDVSLDPPVDTSTNVFVPVDLLDRARRQALLAWADTGGTLVVADPGSPLHGLTATGRGLAGFVGGTARTPACDVGGLADVGEVLHAGWVGYEVPDGGTACFPLGEEGEAWLVVQAVGEGTIVALGSADPFTNAQLDRTDNAVLAATLLGAAPGDRLVVVPRPPVGEGDRGLLDLVAPRVWRGLGLLLLAVLLGLAWRGRRLGPPVAERLPPVVPAAELARSVAALLQRAGSRDGAARLLRERARRDVVAGLRADPTTSPEDLVHLLTARTGLPEATARTALVAEGGGDEDERLVAVARAAAATRAAAVRGLPSRQDDRPRPTDVSTRRPSDGSMSPPPDRTDHP